MWLPCHLKSRKYWLTRRFLVIIRAGYGKIQPLTLVRSLIISIPHRSLMAGTVEAIAFPATGRRAFHRKKYSRSDSMIHWTAGGTMPAAHATAGRRIYRHILPVTGRRGTA